MLLQRLVAIQDREGYLRREAMEQLVSDLHRDGVEIKLRHLHELASFYPHFRLSPPPAVEVAVCRDMACHMHGSADLRRELARRCQALGESVHIEGVSCLGRCDRPPAVRVNDRECPQRDAPSLVRAIEEIASGRPAAEVLPPPALGPAPDWEINYPGDQPPDYRVLKAYLADPDPTRVIGGERDGQAVRGLLETASLLGLGGPGQRSWLKWQDVRKQADPTKFVVCNGDESEPGTFKDRKILQHFPHLTIEGMIIAALVVGARRGFIYIRHEYERPIESVRVALRRAYELGALGPDLFGTGRAFDLEVFVSPGGYICGEATAMIEAMEDRRSEPRNRPPELTVKGLFDRPTLVNNVETFAWVPFILNDGARRYVAAGVSGARGKRLFSISGDIARPGVYEVSVGSTLGELIDRAGGVPHGLKAIAPSGPSGGFIPRRISLNDAQKRNLSASRRESLQALGSGAGPLDMLQVSLDHETFRALEIALGAAIVVYDDTRDMAEQALNAVRFFASETCGKCVPCRLGSRRVVELAERMCGADRDHSHAFRRNKGIAYSLADAMEEGSICGLGQVASKPLTSAIGGFPGDFMPTRTLLPTMIFDAEAEPPPTLERPSRTTEDDFFSRDLLGHLVRMDEPTRAMLQEPVRLLVDGEVVEIARAVHATDPYGELLYDRLGRPVPRRTTLYDAISLRYEAGRNPVPVLCYQEHMSPAAVCRVCLVRLGKPSRRGGGAVDYRTEIVPSCFYPVDAVVGKAGPDDPLVRVETRASAADQTAAHEVRKISRVILEMLAADHIFPDARPEYDFNALVERLGATGDRRRLRFEPRPRRLPLDESSPWFIIDRDACILCDRCVRGCGEVRGHYVIARAGKGSAARIAFDWDSPMGQSSCVQCGECFISCPTNAITIRPGSKPSPWIEEAREVRE